MVPVAIYLSIGRHPADQVAYDCVVPNIWPHHRSFRYTADSQCRNKWKPLSTELEWLRPQAIVRKLRAENTSGLIDATRHHAGRIWSGRHAPSIAKLRFVRSLFGSGLDGLLGRGGNGCKLLSQQRSTEDLVTFSLASNLDLPILSHHSRTSAMAHNTYRTSSQVILLEVSTDCI
jgi:hypothetical protein